MPASLSITNHVPVVLVYPIWIDCSEELRREYLGGVIDARTYAREMARLAHSAPDDGAIQPLSNGKDMFR